MAMKKTAQEYVYDAINYMRKPTADVALSPIQGDDKLMETYGFEHKDICKLLINISNDAEVRIPHDDIHDVEERISVDDLVKYIEQVINKDKSKPFEFSQSVKDAAFMLQAINHISGINSEFAGLLTTLTTLRIITNAIGFTSNEALEKALEDLICEVNKRIVEIDSEFYAEKIKDMTIKQYENGQEEAKEFFKALYERAYKRAALH